MKNLRAVLLSAGLSLAAVSGGVFIAEREGLVLGTYVDPAGIVTECFGQRADGELPGQSRSEAYCLNQLATSLAEYDRELLRLTAGVPLTRGEHAAYLSFIYNAGSRNFGRSTLRKKLLAGDRLGACDELLRWTQSRGAVLPGLAKRRAAERELCRQALSRQTQTPPTPRKKFNAFQSVAFNRDSMPVVRGHWIGYRVGVDKRQGKQSHYRPGRA